LAGFAVLRNIFKHRDDFLFINLTSLLTEVSLVKSGLLHETASVPIGAKKLMDALVKQLNITPAVANSLLKLYQAKQLEVGLSEKVSTILQDFKKTWLAQLREVFSHLSGGISLPSACYFLTQSSDWNFFSTLIDAEDYTQFSYQSNQFKIEAVSETSFLPFIKFQSGPMDSTVAILALFAKINL
jgi:hypothetical protein